MTTTDELNRIAQERARVQSERLHWMLVPSDDGAGAWGGR